MSSDKRLLYIQTIASEGSISKAAKVLYISQSALSQFISNIEKEQGFTLFRRERNATILTYEGELYVNMLLETQTLENNFSRRINELARNSHEKLTLALSSKRAQQLLPTLIPAMRKELPELTVRFRNCVNRSDSTAMVNEGLVDMAITSGPHPWGLITHTLNYQKPLIVVSPDHPMAKKYPDLKDYRTKPKVKLSDFKDDTFIINTPGQGGRANADKYMEEEQFVPKDFIEIYDYRTQLLLAESGMGTAIVSEDTVIPVYSTFKGALFELDTNLISEIFIYHRPSFYISRTLTRFIELCRTAPTWSLDDLDKKTVS